MQQGMRPGAGHGPANFYYEKDVTAEEKERIEMLDQVNILAHNLTSKPAYGMFKVSQRFEQ